jgi:hypothetical protein
MKPISDDRKVRQAAQRVGLTARKSRASIDARTNYGLFQLVHCATGVIVGGE